MTVTYASITPSPPTDGQFYINAGTMPVANADTDLLATPAPVGVAYAEAIAAEVALTVNGAPGSNSTFVVMQGDFGDGNWFDLAWCVTTATSGTVLFYLSNGVAGGAAFGQTRAAGAAPASSGSNAATLPGRIRFIGRSTLSGGTSPTVTVTVKYKLLGLR